MIAFGVGKTTVQDFTKDKGKDGEDGEDGGTSDGEDGEDKDPTPPPPADLVVNVELTGKLPRPIAKADAGSLNERLGRIGSGRAFVRAAPAGEADIEEVFVLGHSVLVRVEMTPAQARSIEGRGVRLYGPGREISPTARVILKPNGDQSIIVEPGDDLETADHLELRDLEDSDKVYIYFAVPRGEVTEVEGIRTGDREQPLDLP